MYNEEAIKIIKSNFPPEQYGLLREALELAISKLQENSISSDIVLADVLDDLLEIDLNEGHSKYYTTKFLDLRTKLSKYFR